MTLISSPLDTFGVKFAKLWIFCISMILIFLLLFGEVSIGTFTPLVCLLFFGIYFFYITVWCVVDEVLEFKNYLIFKKNNIEQKVSLKEIIKLDHPAANFKGLICVHVKKKGNIGKCLTFRAASSPASRFTETKTYNNLKQKIIDESAF